MATESKRDSHNINSIFWGTLILLVGATWLGINIGVVEPSAWGILLKMWPALLIIWGFNIIVSRTAIRFLAYITPLVLVAAFGYAVFYAPTDDGEGWFSTFVLPFTINHNGSTNVGELTEFTYVLDDIKGVERVEVQLSMGAAKLSVMATDEDAASVEVRSNVGEPEVTLDVVGNKLVLEGQSPRVKSVIGKVKQEWEVALPAGLPLSFELDTGASDNNVDLRETLLESLDVESGAVDLDLWLPYPDEQGYDVRIESGASNINLWFPKNAPVRIEADLAVAGTNFREAGLEKQRGYWVSPDYTVGVPFADVNISAGVASVSVHFEE